jgi:ATP-dependent Clp protease ATP-binding subunit ClpC
MEEGKLTDSFGRRVDFRNTILIMTSNVGADIIKNQTPLGFQKQTKEMTYEKMRETLMQEVERHFRPEFLNRLDDVIVFQPLDRNDLKEIVDLELEYIRERLSDRGIELELTDEAKEFLIDVEYNPEFGARPLRRAIERYVEDPMSEEILRGGYEGKNLVRISIKECHLFFEPLEVPECKKKKTKKKKEEEVEPVDAT